MPKPLAEFLKRFVPNGPPAAGMIEQVERELGLQLPPDYKAFMAARDGGEGFVGSHYFVLWRVGDLREFNQDFQVAEYAPGLLLFASTGGGEGYAFDARPGANMVIRMVPFIGMSLRDALHVADNFDHLLTRMDDAHITPTLSTDHERPRGLERFFIKPIILGGSTDDPQNVTYLNRQQHIQVVRYWNPIIAGLRTQQKSE